jgi:ankyrin repeat protein
MRDSGYVSGRNSPFTLLELEEEQHNIQPTDEFKGLYRVPCKRHEPQPAIFMSMMPAAHERRSKEQYKNVTTCPDCLYSAIHNLSWSATHLKLQVFQAELKLDSLYNITALDIVGNSALHYAAAGGADSEYFVSLMQVGVNPYQLNTEGQLFLHCLRPNETAGLDSLELLSINLVNTLNHMNSLDPKGTSASLHWRDNEGRTVLDTLVTHIPDVAMKNQTFRCLQYFIV